MFLTYVGTNTIGMKKKKAKIRILYVAAVVIIGALVLYIIVFVWYYLSLWIPMHESQKLSREVDMYIREHGYEKAIRRINPDLEIRSKEELGL